MRGRAADIVDISRRINEILMMHDGILNNKGISYNHEGSVVLAADDLVPSETVQLDQKAVAGIVTSKGSNRSHTAIFARTMGIPTIVCVGDSLTEDLEGHFVIVDGNSGRIYVDPDNETIERFSEIKKTVDVQNSHLEEFRGKQSVCKLRFTCRS